MEIYNVNIILQLNIGNSPYTKHLHFKEQCGWNVMGEESKTS